MCTPCAQLPAPRLITGTGNVSYCQSDGRLGELPDFADPETVMSEQARAQLSKTSDRVLDGWSERVPTRPSRISALAPAQPSRTWARARPVMIERP